MTKDEFREVLRMHIARKYKKQSAAARAWGVSDAFVSVVLKGEKCANEAMLIDAGFKVVKTDPRYVRLKSTDKDGGK